MSGSSIPVWYGLISTVGPLGGAIVGYWASGRNDEARDKRAAERERTAKRLDTELARAAGSHAFQRDLYLDLQDQLQLLVRSSSKQIMADEATLKSRGRLFQLPEGLSDEAFTLDVTINRLLEHILDDELRDAIHVFHLACTGLTMEAITAEDKDPKALLRLLERNRAQLVTGYQRITERLGAALRKELGPETVTRSA